MNDRTFITTDANDVIIGILHGPLAGVEDLSGITVLPSSAVTHAEIGGSCVNGKLTPSPVIPKELWLNVVSKRCTLLTRSDWTQTTDSPLTPAQQSAWRVYRQSLRDITKQPDPANITWPKEPII